MFQPTDRTNSKYWPILDREIELVKKLIRDDINPVYTGFEDFLCDWGPNFSWTVEAAVLQYEDLLNSPEWMRLAQDLKQARGYDFVEAIAEDLSEVWAGNV